MTANENGSSLFSGKVRPVPLAVRCEKHARFQYRMRLSGAGTPAGRFAGFFAGLVVNPVSVFYREGSLWSYARILWKNRCIRRCRVCIHARSAGGACFSGNGGPVPVNGTT